MNIEEIIKSLDRKKYAFLIFFIQIISYFISYKNLFSYERCTELVTRSFQLINRNFDLVYPLMCDEPFYFHGFQWIHAIYENGFPYQDRQLYLLIGFIIYRFFFVLSYLLQFIIDPVSLLLFSTLILQILVLNAITYMLSLIINGRFDRFYSIFYFLIVLFSFEQRRYFFLPSSSTIYFLIFLFSIYSIQEKKINGFIFGSLFTISGYGIIGFIYQILSKVINFKKNWRIILKNLIYFILPTLFFEFFRVAMGYLRGPEHGVKYIYNAEVYQQFVWFFRSLLDPEFTPSNACQEITQFINCYINQTLNFFNYMKIYFVIFVVLLIFMLLTKNINNMNFQINIINFTLFSYIFISFQGYYQFRIIYYSLGFFLILFFCIFIYNFGDFKISLSLISLLSYYTVSRKSFNEYIDLGKIDTFEISLFVLLVFLLLKNYRKSNHD